MPLGRPGCVPFALAALIQARTFTFWTAYAYARHDVDLMTL
jgi:hypothetical protein